MSEENEPIIEETAEVQPAADTPEPQADVEPPKAGKSRKKGKRAAAPEPGPVDEEPSAIEAIQEVEAPLAEETLAEAPAAEEIPGEQAGEIPAEESLAEPVEESVSEVTAETPSEPGAPEVSAEAAAEPAVEVPAESEAPVEPPKGRKSRKKGKRSEEPAAPSDGAVSEEGAPASGEAGPPEENGSDDADAQESAEPADESTRLALPLVVEAILFASQKPMSAKEILSVFKGAAEAVKEVPDAPARAFVKIKEPHLRDAIESLEIACAAPDRAYEVRESAAGWQLVTKPEYSPWLRQLFPEHRSARLSAPAMETLAIIAYRQPITRADIEAVRGVAVDGVMQTLLDRGLVKIAGRADVPGRPLLYDTTQNFMEHFGLKNLDDLPNAAELRKISLPTAEPPAAETPAAAASTEAPASSEAPTDAAPQAPAEPATEVATAEPELVEALPEAQDSPEPAEETPSEPAEAAEVETAEAAPVSEFVPEPEISETPLSSEASEEETRPEN